MRSMHLRKEAFMEKENKIDSREKDEKLEGEETLDSNVPGTRFQKKQQVQKPVKDAADERVGNNPFTPKKVDVKGAQLKQEQVARVITGTGGSVPVEGVASPSRAGLRTLAYSGNEGTILGNPSGTPVVGAPSRSDTRPGQKLDAVAKDIDFLASEQAVISVDGSKPLQDNPEETQGFLGHPENISARIQKIAEAVPGGLLYARSCDEIRRDEIAFVEGQMVKEKDIEYRADPTLTYDEVKRGYKPYNVKRGNYIPKTMHIGLKGGKVIAMSFDVDELNVEVTADVANKSSSAYIRKINQDEINRQNMEAIAGIETEKNWCPLVRAVEQPTQTVGRCTDDEVLTASEQFMAYRFINKALSYAMNKASKDGQTPYRSFKEMLKGNAVKHQKAIEYDDDAYNFDGYDYVNGAPSLMIALYDSIAKYSKRGDLFVQPRSWRMHKQTADNNINLFRLKPEFATYVANRDVFSTIDRNYDPFMPVCISDNWRLSHVLDFNKLLNFTQAKRFKVQLGGKGVMAAGTAFDNIYADQENAKATLSGYASSAQQTGDIYDYFGLKNALDYGDAELVLLRTGDADNHWGFDDETSATNAAIAYLDELVLKGNNIQMKPHVVLVKQFVNNGIDKVFAICQYPNILAVTETPNVILNVALSTTTDYMKSDVTKNTVLLTQVNIEVDQFEYKYQNRQNPYYTKVLNPLLFGIKEWAVNLAAKLSDPAVSSGATHVTSLKDTQQIIWYHIPVVHSTTNISLWDLIVCASIPFAQKIRTNSQFDTLNYVDMNGKYPYEQLVAISDANPLAAVNYGFAGILQPLKVGTMKPAVALSWIMPEKFWRIDHTVSGGAMTHEVFVLPFYYSEEQFAFSDDDGSIVIDYADEGHVMNYPSTRAGARLAYLDDFYGLTERDVRLSLDMMTDVPQTIKGTNHPVAKGVYKYGLSNSGIPVLDYSNGKPLNIGALLSTPRELGLGVVAPYGYNAPGMAKHLSNSRVTFTDYSTLSSLISEGTSYTVRAWHVAGGSYRALHAQSQLVIDRGGNFAQDWAIRADAIYADADNTSVEVYGTLDAHVDIGIALNFNDIMEVNAATMGGESGKSSFKPFTDGNNVNVNTMPSIITLQNALWPRMQLLPFTLSPFDQTPEGRLVDAAHVTVDMTADPYDFMYIFGFCGFKASDFREDVFNRIYEKQTLGWTFIKDPFVLASPVLK